MDNGPAGEEARGWPAGRHCKAWHGARGSAAQGGPRVRVAGQEASGGCRQSSAIPAPAPASRAELTTLRRLCRALAPRTQVRTSRMHRGSACTDGWPQGTFKRVTSACTAHQSISRLFTCSLSADVNWGRMDSPPLMVQSGLVYPSRS
jgi:hypothetical protein